MHAPSHFGAERLTGITTIFESDKISRFIVAFLGLALTMRMLKYELQQCDTLLVGVEFTIHRAALCKDPCA